MVRPSSPIAPTDRLDSDLLAACDKAEEANNYHSEPEDQIVESDSDSYTDQAFLDQDLDTSSDDESDFLEEIDDTQSRSSRAAAEDASEHTFTQGSTRVRNNHWIDDCRTPNARLKLIQILKDDAVVPKSWGMEKMLATLVYHQKDKNLHTLYRQFKQFAYETMLKKSNSQSETC